MLHNKILYSYNDVMIEPAVLSNISSRSECIATLDGTDNMMPLFTAPMSTVVNERNYEIFKKNGIYPILPRNIDVNIRFEYATHGEWASFSLQEFKKLFCDDYNMGINPNVINDYKVLVDVANGHMSILYDLVRKAKKIHGNKITIMIGNIANPKTYFECYRAGVDYIRCGIGAGNGCISSSNVSIHYSMASLIDEVYQEKINTYRHNNFLNKTWNEMPKIIADGGVRNYSDVIKAYALGSDYVMIGSVFASLLESAGTTFEKRDDGSFYYYELNKINDYTKFLNEHKIYPLYKEFYGMASREGQIAINGKKTKTAEGITKVLLVTGTIPQWSENMNAYLRSAMSYCNIKDIKDFNPENVVVNVISSETKNSINK